MDNEDATTSDNATEKASSGDQLSSDPIVRAVQDFTGRYNNKNFKKTQSSRLGRASIYTVTFKGQDSLDYTHYVFVRTRRDLPQVFRTLDELFNGIGSIITDPLTDSEIIQTYVLAIVTFVLTGAAVYLAIKDSEGKSFPLVMTLVGSIIGYLIGERRNPR